jgi:Uma2 family endonuclease
MTAVMTLPWGRPLTADDYFALETPDDGRRYELLDGVLVVSPSPVVAHQWASSQLFGALYGACPADLRVFHAPLDVRLSDDTVVQPDLIVVPAADTLDRRLSGIPVLAVEILSDSTRRYDLLLKRSRYERAGIPSYWVVDPDTSEITICELAGEGTYVDVARESLRQRPLTVERPFPVTVRLER